MTPLQKILSGLMIALFAIQLLPYRGSNPPERTEPEMAPEVREILTRSCYDCHSNRTTWPWYSQVAPVSWWIVHHVNEGREHLNFSEWDRLDSKERGKAGEEIADEVSEGGMPLASYVVGHPEATLSDGDRQILLSWANGLRDANSSARQDGEHTENRNSDDSDD